MDGGVKRVVAMFTDGADAIGIFVGPAERCPWLAGDARRLVRPVGQQLGQVRERAHHRPLAFARRSIQDLCRQSLDLQDELIHAAFETLDALLCDHASQCKPDLFESLGAIAYTESYWR